MDEMNKTPGEDLTVNQFEPGRDAHANQGDGHAKSQPTTRSITSKRVIIPADAKRAAKRAQSADSSAPAISAETALETIAPTTVKPDVAATPIIDTSENRAESVAAPTERVEPHPAILPPTDAPTIFPAIPLAATADTRPITPNVLGQPRQEPVSGSRGLSPTALPYLPSEATLAADGGASKQNNRTLEFALWGIAALLLLATAFFIVPRFFPNLFSNQGAVANPPTATAQLAVAATRAPSPTTTLLPTQAATQAAPVIATDAPLIIPTPPSDGQQLSLLTDGALTGWAASDATNVNFGDAGLVAGSRDGKTYSSILNFNLRNLPTDTRILFGVLELTGRDNSELGSSGEWQFDIVENPLGTDWSAATAEQINNAKSLGVLGALKASDLGSARLNRIFFDESQMQLLAQQFQNGTVVIRIRGPQDGGNNLFTWESGVGGSAANAPTLHLVTIPGHYVIITNTPAPRNVLTAAAHVVRGTDAAKRNGTPTPFPPGVATATPGGEQVEIPVETAIAGNDATAIARSQLATAIARTTGTYTPTPKGVILIFPTFTPVVISPNELATATPIPEDANLLDIPIDYEKCDCQGRILLFSTRYGGERPYPIMIEPDGAEVGKLSGDLFYRLAAAREPYSPDRKRRIIYPNDSRGIQQIAIEDIETGDVKFITSFTKGVAYDAAWAPDNSAIVFVSTEVDNADQIYLYDFGTEQITILIKTPGGQPWFKHPSWSPDSQQIAYWSSVSGKKQIWVMNRDGSNPINISNNTFNEFDPVWVK